MTNVLLFSGGLDSFIHWRLLNHPPCVYVNAGHRYEDAEISAIERLSERIPELKVTQVGRLYLGDLEAEDSHIPYRNLLFAIIAVLQMDTPSDPVKRVYVGALSGEISRDKSDKFFKDATSLLSYMEKPIKVEAPFRRLTKSALVSLYLKSGYSEQDLYLTRSCYHAAPSEKPCGRCMACFRRWVAMANNGITESHQHDPLAWAKEQAIARPLDFMSYLGLADPREIPAILRNQWQAWKAGMK